MVNNLFVVFIILLFCFYNDNFDMMMDFVDTSIGESKDYVDGFMPAMSSSTSGKFLTNNGSTASWVNIPLPAGFIGYYGGSYAPSGWLVCDGSAISRVTYADLFSAIGDTFGEGDGSTTFNLPDLVSDYPFVHGSTTVGTKKEAGLPNITGQFVSDLASYIKGAIYRISSVSGNVGGGSDSVVGFDANKGATYWNAASEDIYGGSTTVQPPALTLLPIIKY